MITCKKVKTVFRIRNQVKNIQSHRFFFHNIIHICAELKKTSIRIRLRSSINNFDQTIIVFLTHVENNSSPTDRAFYLNGAIVSGIFAKKTFVSIDSFYLFTGSHQQPTRLQYSTSIIRFYFRAFIVVALTIGCVEKKK